MRYPAIYIHGKTSLLGYSARWRNLASLLEAEINKLLLSTLTHNATRTKRHFLVKYEIWSAGEAFDTRSFETGGKSFISRSLLECQRTIVMHMCVCYLLTSTFWASVISYVKTRSRQGSLWCMQELPNFGLQSLLGERYIFQYATTKRFW